jgi:hypothetical protein
MSGLKVKRHIDEDTGIVFSFYGKYEADKVIAEKDAVIAKLKAKLEGAKNETNYWCNNLKVFAQKKDAEIAELKADYKESCDRLQTANLIKDEQLAAARHQKCKRCLAIARWCKRRRIDAADYRIPRKKWEFYDKWHRLWLELAEKFKTNSTAQ